MSRNGKGRPPMITRFRLGRILAALALMGLLAARLQAEPARYEWPLALFVRSDKAATVRLEATEGVAERGGIPLPKPNVLRLDCTNCTERLIDIPFAIPQDRMKEFRGKRMVFKAQVKYLQGAGTLSVRMRAFGDAWKPLFAGQGTNFTGEKGHGNRSPTIA